MKDRPIYRIDLWIGKTLFVPLIIRLCQATGMTQYAVARYSTLIAILCLLVNRPTDVGGWLIYALLAAVAVLHVCFAALNPNMPRQASRAGYRMFLILIFLTLVVLPMVFGAPFRTSSLYWVFCLIAEYATTITTIPPLEEKKTESTKSVVSEPA